MASARAVESLKSLITCDICFMEFEGRDPRSLPCLHTYCRPCIQKLYDTAVKDKRHGVDSIICPTCQRESILPHGIVTALPRYFQASQVTDILKNFQTVSLDNDNVATTTIAGSSETCTSCEISGTTSLEYCFTCAQSLCRDCAEIHRNNTRFSSHVRIPLNGRSLKVFSCHEHDKLIGLFCANCWIPICKRCELTSHATHDIKEYRPPCPEHKSVIAEIRSQIASLDGDIENVEKDRKEFKKHLDVVEDNVTKHKEKLMKQIEEQEALVRIELSKIDDDTSNKFSNNKIRIHRSKDIVQELEKEMQQIVDPLSIGVEVGLEGVDTLVDGIRERIPSRSKRERSPRRQLRYAFVPEIENVFFGYISDNSEYGRSQSTFSGNQGDILSDVNDPHERYCREHSISEGTQFVENKECTLKRMNNPHQGRRKMPALLLTIQTNTNIQNVSFLADGKIVAIIGSSWISPSQLNTYNPKGELVKLPFNTSSVKRPYCLATHHNTHTLAVAGWSKYGYCINAFFPSGGVWKSRYQDIPYEPWTMAFTTEGHIIIGTNKRILKYQAKGRILMFEKQTDHFCRHLAVGSNGRIIISDGQQIHVYTAAANKMFTFPQNTSTILQPCGVCVDSKNNIIVADAETKSVLLFSQCGTLVRELVNFSAAGSPHVISLYRERYLIVSVGGKTLNLFDIPL